MCVAAPTTLSQQQVRLCLACSEGDQASRPPDPFANPNPALVVARLAPDHLLLLNKFNVVAHHLLVITEQFEHQSERLTVGDLAATWRVLQASYAGCLVQGAWWVGECLR